MENQNTEQQIPEVQSEQSQTPPAPSLPRRDPGRLNDKLKLPKLVFLGIVFVILLGIIGGAYVLGRNSVFKELNPTAPEIPPPGPVFQASPTPEQTANWKTYTNTKYGYSIKVPRDWKTDHDEDLELLLYLYSPCSDDIGKVCSSIQLLSGEVHFQRSKSNETTIKVAGENAQAYEIFDNNDESSDYYGLIYVIILNHHGKPFSILYQETLKGQNFKNSSDFRNKTIFDQILSTFTFTK